MGCAQRGRNLKTTHAPGGGARLHVDGCIAPCRGVNRCFQPLGKPRHQRFRKTAVRSRHHADDFEVPGAARRVRFSSSKWSLKHGNRKRRPPNGDQSVISSATFLVIVNDGESFHGRSWGEYSDSVGWLAVFYTAMVQTGPMVSSRRCFHGFRGAGEPGGISADSWWPCQRSWSPRVPGRTTRLPTTAMNTSRSGEFSSTWTGSIPTSG